MKTQFLLVLVFILTTSVFAGGKTDTGKIRVATKATMEGSIVNYAEKKGYFKDEGLEVEIFMFATGAPINEAMAAKEADIAASGNATIFSLVNGECTLLTELVSASGGMGIYIRPNSPILADKGKVKEYENIFGSSTSVKNRVFLGTLGTSMQLNILKYASRFGLSNSDVKITNMDMGPAYQAFIAGNGDAIATVSPYSFQLLAAGYIEAASYREAVGSDITDALFVRTEYLTANRENVVKFVRAMMKAAHDLQNYDTAVAYNIPFYNENGKSYTEKILQEELLVKSYLWKTDYTQNDYVFGGSFINQVDFFIDIGSIRKDMAGNVKKACDPSVLNEALGINLPKP